MALDLSVPSIQCEGCAETITKALKAQDGNAKVEVNVEKKTVSVDANMSESSIKQTITAAGHSVE